MHGTTRKSDRAGASTSWLQGLMWLAASAVFILIFYGRSIKPWIQTAQNDRMAALRNTEDARVRSLQRNALDAARHGDDAAFVAAMARIKPGGFARSIVFCNLADEGNIHALNVWYRNGWPVSKSAEEGSLFQAVLHARPKVVRLFLDKGVRYAPRSAGEPSLIEAACTDSTPQIVELVLSSGADVNRKSIFFNTPPPNIAYDHLRPPDGLFQNDPNWTPLMYSAYLGRQKIVAILLRHHADVQARSGHGLTALKLALHFKKSEVERLLMRAGARE